MIGRRVLSGWISLILFTASSQAAIKVACVGDSITWGQGAREEGHADLVYPAVLQTLLGTNYNVGNFGASGSTLLSRGSLGNGIGDAYINREQFIPSRNFDADIIMIMLGTNDGHNQLTNQTAGLSLWTNDCDALIAQYTNGKAIPPTIIIATAAWPPSSAFVSQDVIGNLINPMIRDYAAQRGYVLVDIWNTTVNSPYDPNKVGHDATDWWYDPVHPYIYGYGQIANAFYAGLTQPPATGAPSVNIAAAMPIGQTTATLNGNVISTGALPTAVTFVWAATDLGTNLATWSNSMTVGYRPIGSVSATISGLVQGETYRARVYASNSLGVAWSSATTFVTKPTNFIAYNDIAWDATQISNKITSYSVLSMSGALVDYATGAALDAHVGLTSSNGAFWSFGLVGGAPAGSPAAIALPSNIVNSEFHCYFDSATVNVTGLDPTRLYSIVFYANRGGDPFSGDYTSRYTTVTLNGASSFQNNGTTGTVNQAATSTTMKTGVPHGEIFRFDQINPGGDGAVAFDVTGFKPCLNSFKILTPSTNAGGGQGASTTLIAMGDSWKFHNDGTLPATNWTATAYGEPGWLTGTAPLGYNDAAIVTTLNDGGIPSSRWITYYFRKHFVITNLASVTGMLAQYIADDGAVFYLNGTKIHTSTNMPLTGVDNSTLAASFRPEPYSAYTFTVNPSALLLGDNVLSVEVHQAAPDSSDLYFDMDLIRVAYATTNQPGGLSTNAPATPTDWTAFNDALWNGANETYNNTYSTNSPTTGANGPLMTTNGEVLSSSVSFNTASAVSLASVTVTNVALPPGTDAYNVFNGRVGHNNVSDWASGFVTMTLVGLNTSKQYSVVLFCSRLGDSTQYTDRWTVVTISSADSFANNSSAAAPKSTTTSANDTTRLSAGLLQGLVARYDLVRPGADGTIAFSLTGTGTNGQSHGYLNAFMVQESAVTGGMVDTDTDGMDDAWEQTNFGGLNQPNAGPTQDFDGDGFDNYSEFRAGTDPQSASSRLELTNIVAPTGTPGQVVLQWGGVTSKTYAIEIRSNLTSGAWTILQSGIPGGSGNSFTGTTATLRNYWRIKVE